MWPFRKRRSQPDTLDEQLALYFSRDTSPYPKSNPEAVLSAYGAAALKRIEALVTDMESIAPDWSNDDLASATQRAVDEMRRRHPGLGAKGAAILGWAYSYGYK